MPEGTCRVCGCTESDCRECLKASGSPCYWVEADLCSRCLIESLPGAARFSRDEVIAAGEEWNFNCGPGALCAVLGMKPAQLRPHLLDFERKGYTNPTLMFGVLKGLKVDHYPTYRGDDPAAADDMKLWPIFGLVRIQWGGRWTNPGVPMAARYRQTHWIAARWTRWGVHIFDINCSNYTGWSTLKAWREELVPWLCEDCVPGWDGRWWPTHAIEVVWKGGHRG